jgi:purine catabolism regulator
VATLVDLRAAVLPGGRWLTGEPAAGADLGWVRLLRARIPAFDALERGDVVIVPRPALAVVAPDDETLATLVRGCIEADVAALVLVSDPDAASPASDLATDAIVRVAGPAGLPVLDAGAGDAPALERSAIGFLVNHRAELERQATILETRLERVALDEGGPDALAAAIAGFLGRAVAIEGRRGATVAVHLPPDVPDATAAVAAYHDRRRAAARIPLPIPGDVPTAGGGISASGALALLGERPPSELERIATSRVAGLLALELAKDEALGRAIESARREQLPADGPPWVVIVARQAGMESAPDLGAREALRRDLRSLAPARRLTLRGDAQSVELRVVAALDDGDEAGTEIAGRIAAFLDRVVAVSRPFAVATGRSAAEAEARQTLEAAEGLATPPRVARADRLPAFRLLGNLHNVPDGARQARALLAPLLGSRPDVRREHLATLRAILDHPGLAEAATSLGVHRNTVAYRVRRIEALTGWQLGDPDLRFPLALALRLVQEDQAS